jgi:spermidine synthase
MKLLARWRRRNPEPETQGVYVSERLGVRSLHIGSDTIQSSMRIARPFDLELAYTRSMMAFLLFVPSPRDVLMIGLGGGSLAKFIHREFPGARVRAVEINPRVVAVARQSFELPADRENFEVLIADGADFVTREDVRCDVLIVDGYEAHGHVETLASEEFYACCLERLRPSGVLVVNLWSGGSTFGTLLERISGTFTGGTLCLPAERPGNVIVFAFERPPGAFAWRELEQRGRALAVRHGLEFPRFVEALREMNPHDHEALYP